MSAPEFSRPVSLDSLGEAPRSIEIEAGESERAALAKRFGLVSLTLLNATACVARSGEEVRARGRIEAEAVQSCVVTAEPVPAHLDLPFELVFRPQSEGGPDEEIELEEGDLDIVFYEGAAIDLGEAAAETLALGLDPYPRAPGAAAALKAAGVRSEEEAGPFGALAGLRDKLGK